MRYPITAFVLLLSITSIAQVSLALKVMLDGPYDAGTGLMRDDLRSQGLIPMQEPYSGVWNLLGGAGGETTNGWVLSATGNNAIVDWVLVELRSAVHLAMVLSSQCALVQRDGDIVGTNGTSALNFPVAPGAYHVAVRHRNHLAVMTATPVTLESDFDVNSDGPLNLDFSNGNTATFGSDARKLLGAVALLWAGDANSNGVIRYTGIDNDRDAILVAIGGVVPTAALDAVYRTEDVNMDGSMRYTGQDNDRDPILQNIGGVVPTASKAQQVLEVLSTPGTGFNHNDGENYTTIVLNNGQEWMAENLRTRFYRDGTTIPNVTDNTAWAQLNSDAWCFYLNSFIYEPGYGRLYNWYAAANPNLCPQGWHLPTDAEWQQLESALGMPDNELGQTGLRGHGHPLNVGAKMKSNGEGWWSYLGDGTTDASGFSGLPGGLRFSSNGSFNFLGNYGYWWSASESGAETAWVRHLSEANEGIDRSSWSRRFGFCVRCVRD